MNLKEIAKAKKLKKPPKLKGIKEPKAVEREYIKLLKQLTAELKRDVRENILPLLKDAKLTTDSTDDILIALANLSAKFANITSFANSTSNIIVDKIDKSNKQRFLNSVNQSIGVDLTDIIQEENLSDLVALQKSKNVSLIKSIPQEFIKDIEVIVQNGLADGLRHEAIAKQISGIKDINSVFGKLENRVKLIARNEVSTINSSISKKRSENLGITKGIWRTARDERVRGNPSGKYPDSKDNHWALEGVEFDLSKGAKDPRSGKMIFPGQPINCRCYFESIIE